jgi:hypothetical protein
MIRRSVLLAHNRKGVDSMRSRLFLFTAAMSFLVCVPLLALFGQADSTGSVPIGVGPVLSGTTALIGILASLATGLVTKGAKGLDTKLGTVDASIRKGIGPVLPVVTMGLSILIPIVGKAIGVSNLPTADVIAQAPTAAIIGIAGREAFRKWIFPLFSKGGIQ